MNKLILICLLAGCAATEQNIYYKVPTILHSPQDRALLTKVIQALDGAKARQKLKEIYHQEGAKLLPVVIEAMRLNRIYSMAIYTTEKTISIVEENKIPGGGTRSRGDMLKVYPLNDRDYTKAYIIDEFHDFIVDDMKKNDVAIVNEEQLLAFLVLDERLHEIIIKDLNNTKNPCSGRMFNHLYKRNIQENNILFSHMGTSKRNKIIYPAVYALKHPRIDTGLKKDTALLALAKISPKLAAKWAKLYLGNGWGSRVETADILARCGGEEEAIKSLIQLLANPKYKHSAERAGWALRKLTKQIFSINISSPANQLIAQKKWQEWLDDALKHNKPLVLESLKFKQPKNLSPYVKYQIKQHSEETDKFIAKSKTMTAVKAQ